MPEKIKGSPIEIMKAISMFDIETDYNDTQAKEKLDILFHNLIISKDPKAKEFLARFLKGVSNIIADMGIIERPEEEPVDDVEMPDEAPEETTEEKPTEEPIEDEVPDELLGAGYNRLITHANSFLYS